MQKHHFSVPTFHTPAQQRRRSFPDSGMRRDIITQPFPLPSSSSSLSSSLSSLLSSFFAFQSLHFLSHLVFLVIFQCLLDGSTQPSRLYLVLSISMKYDIPTLLALSRNACIDTEKFSSQAVSSMCSSGIK